VTAVRASRFIVKLEGAKFVAAAFFALAVMVSTGPLFSVALPLGPGLAWKRFVPADLAFALLLVVWVIAVALEGRAAFRRPVWHAVIPLSAIAFTVLLSPEPSRGMPDVGRFTYSLLVFVLFTQMPPARIHRFVTLYVAGGALVTSAALVAYVAFLLLDWHTPFVQAAMAPGWQATIALRAAGPFAHPTTLAVFINSVMFFALVLLVISRGRRDRHLATLTVVVSTLTLFLTSSRAIGGVLLAIFLVALLSPHRRPRDVIRTLVLAEIVIVFSVLAAVTLVWDFFPFSFEKNPQTRFASLTFYTAPEERRLIYTAAVRMFLEHPVVGVGPGRFEENVKRYVSFTDFEAAARFFNNDVEQVRQRYRVGPDPHSSWFGWLARAGLVGFGGLAFFFGTQAVALFRARREDGARGRLAVLAFAFLIGFLYDGLAVEILHLRFFWIFLGVTAPLIGQAASPPARRGPS
jgi:O-antigen ligase